MYSVVLVTAKDTDEARKIARELVNVKLAACCNIIKEIESIYRWQGKVEESGEALLIIKTKKSLLPKLIKKVKSVHSYSVPEVIALPITVGNKDYLNWIKESCLR